MINYRSNFGICSESEHSGSTFVTPQQKRRRVPTHAIPAKHPHYRRNRKVSAPPELQAHLGKKSVPTINFTQASQKGSSNPDSCDTSSTTELIINLNNSNNKLGKWDELQCQV